MSADIFAPLPADSAKKSNRLAIKNTSELNSLRVACDLKFKSPHYVFCPKDIQVCPGRVVQDKNSVCAVCVRLRFIKKLRWWGCRVHLALDNI
jgi:hypothetical protein